MGISPEISSIQKIIIFIIIIPCFILNNNLVIIVMHIYSINIVLFYYFKNSNEFILNASNLSNRIFYRWTLMIVGGIKMATMCYPKIGDIT